MWTALAAVAVTLVVITLGTFTARRCHVACQDRSCGSRDEPRRGWLCPGSSHAPCTERLGSVVNRAALESCTNHCLFAVSPTGAVEPTPHALPASLVGNQNTDTVVPLPANVLIPDAGELNWPVNVPDSPTAQIADVRVDVRGLWHEQASDLVYVTRNAEWLSDV